MWHSDVPPDRRKLLLEWAGVSNPPSPQQLFCGVPCQHDSSCVELLTLQTLETTKPPTGLTTEPPMGLRPLGLGLLLAESMSEVRLSEVGGAPKQLGEIIVGRAPQDKAAGLLG